MPSLHVGWSVLVAIAVARAIKRPVAYAFAVLMPTAMALAIVVTANHYVADVLVGVQSPEQQQLSWSRCAYGRSLLRGDRRRECQHLGRSSELRRGRDERARAWSRAA